MKTVTPWVALLFVCCGPREQQAQDALSCPLPTGTFKAIETLQSSSGTCSSAKATSDDTMQFDAHGNYLPPLSGLISCKTRYEGCGIDIQCSPTIPFDASASFAGTVDGEATHLTGTATVKGSYKGCDEVVYAVVADKEG